MKVIEMSLLTYGSQSNPFSDPASRYELTLKWLHNRILELDSPQS